MNKELIVIPASAVRQQTVENERPLRLRVAAYCRVSTEQEEQLESCENQVSYFKSYIESHDEYEYAGIYVDEGISGTNARRRKAFLSMIEDCRDGKIDMIVTKSISRFARNTQDCLKYTRMLKDLNVTVYFEKENIRTSDNTGELLFTILSSLAQEESRNISENTKWGIRSNFKRGIPHFKTSCLYGYGTDTNGELIVIREKAIQVRRIYQEFLEGYTYHEIAKHLNTDSIKGPRDRVAWSSVTIRRMLANEQYKGDVIMQKLFNKDYIDKKSIPNSGQLPMYVIKEDHEAIVDPHLWEVVQDEIRRREYLKKQYHLRMESGDSPLTGKVLCANCGLPLLRKIDHGGVRSWQCRYGCGQSVREPLLLMLIYSKLIHIVMNRRQYIPEWNRILKEGTPFQIHFCRKTLCAFTDPMKLDLYYVIRACISHVLIQDEISLNFKYEYECRTDE